MDLREDRVKGVKGIAGIKHAHSYFSENHYEIKVSREMTPLSPLTPPELQLHENRIQDNELRKALIG